MRLTAMESDLADLGAASDIGPKCSEKSRVRTRACSAVRAHTNGIDATIDNKHAPPSGSPTASELVDIKLGN